MSLRQQIFSFLSHRLISLVKALYKNLLPECTIMRIFRCNFAKFSLWHSPGTPSNGPAFGTSPKVDLWRHTIVTKLCPPPRKFSAYGARAAMVSNVSSRIYGTLCGPLKISGRSLVVHLEHVENHWFMVSEVVIVRWTALWRFRIREEL